MSVYEFEQRPTAIRANISSPFRIFNNGELIVRRPPVRFRKREPLLSVLLETGLQLLDSVRERLPDDMDDMKDRVRAGYGTASERVSRAANALRGEDESHILGTVVRCSSELALA